MRWIDKKPKPGDKRIVSGFLFLPKRLKGQYRWLEFTEWWQVFVGSEYNDWCDISWADDEAARVEMLRTEIKKHTSSITKGTPE